VPEWERLREILEEVGINDPATCNEETESLGREIGDRASQRWTDGRTPTGRGPVGGARPPSKRRCGAATQGPQRAVEGLGEREGVILHILTGWIHMSGLANGKDLTEDGRNDVDDK